MTAVTMEKVVNLCKRRGFVFPGSEIYGGLGASLDYGPLGVELKRNVKDAWWRSVVTSRDDIVGLDCAILMHPRVWEASGHLAGFTDPLVDCKECKQRFRADHLSTRSARSPQVPGECGGELTEARQFNLMFKTFMGPVEDTASVVYLRPETAQGIFVNFQNVLRRRRARSSRSASRQIGKSFRNEITPGNFLFRTREFEQMEMEFFVKPGEDDHWFEYWTQTSASHWYPTLGIRPEQPAPARRTAPDELAHYAKGCADVEYEFPFGWSELEGIANRTDFDLKRHAEFSGKDLTLLRRGDAASASCPYVIEPAAGADRADAGVPGRRLRRGRGRGRDARRAAPRTRGWRRCKAAVFPLLRKDGQPEKAPRDLDDLLRAHFPVALRPGRLDRPALSAPGRDRHAVRHHRRPPDHAGRHRHAARPRLDAAGAHPDRSTGRRADAAHRRVDARRAARAPSARTTVPMSAEPRRAHGRRSARGGTTARAARAGEAPRQRAHSSSTPSAAAAPTGDAEMKNLLGGKGANLAEMAGLGLPVPPGFTISTEVCTYYYAHGRTLPARRCAPRSPKHLARIEKVGRQALRRRRRIRCSSRCAPARAPRCPA